ncbi:5-oxoprolinase subunit PxpA [uncultured Cohaesibacter sp.]|uniref:5-oxoprolinase subunit PxpA n=1 Tax=uncultured Cohaesibacter sp. TaxID=1002546 RepID=UPI003749C1FB
MGKSVDLNCDMGEGFGAYRIGDEAAMLDIVTTANIACGFHAGDPVVMRETILAAKQRKVSIGAHPSFMDLYGFGRRRILGDSPEDLEAQIVYQIAAIDGMARTLGWPITHMKTHGALGNMAAEDPELAAICIRATKAVNPDLVIVALPYSEIMKAAEKAGMAVVCEVYADRTYTAEGMLTPAQGTRCRHQGSRPVRGTGPYHGARWFHPHHCRDKTAGRGRPPFASMATPPAPWLRQANCVQPSLMRASRFAPSPFLHNRSFRSARSDSSTRSDLDCRHTRQDIFIHTFQHTFRSISS